MTRRDFVRTSAGAGAFAAATLACSRKVGAAPLRAPIGLELYSVRNLLPKDFEGTLRQVGEAGYKEVEAAGFYNKPAAEFKSAMDRAGLRCISAHYTLTQFRTQFDELAEYAHGVGLEYMICSSSGGVHRDPNAKGEPSLDDWRYIAEEFNRVGAKVKAAGMTFGVHNHVPEFAVKDGVVVYDELLKLTDPKMVIFEMDCGWVTAAGHNPVDYLNKTPERFPLLHVKDMTHEASGGYHSVVLGTGVIDYQPILRAATGMKHYFVEQEEFAGDTMTELRADAAYMRKMDA